METTRVPTRRATIASPNLETIRVPAPRAPIVNPILQISGDTVTGRRRAHRRLPPPNLQVPRLHGSTIVKRKDGLVLRSIGGDSLLVPTGARVAAMPGLVVLNGTGRCMWELLAQERSVDELAAAVAERFDVDDSLAHADAQSFLDEMARMGLVQP